MPIVSKFPFIMQDDKVPLDVNHLDSVFVWTSTCMNHPNFLILWNGPVFVLKP